MNDLYNIKCGWGWTLARLQYTYLDDINGKTVYHWISTKGFRFLSYDLDDTVKL